MILFQFKHTHNLKPIQILQYVYKQISKYVYEKWLFSLSLFFFNIFDSKLKINQKYKMQINIIFE